MTDDSDFLAKVDDTMAHLKSPMTDPLIELATLEAQATPRPWMGGRA